MKPELLSRLRSVRLPWPRDAQWRRAATASLAFVLLTLLWLCSGDGGGRTWPREQILAAIRFVESGDRENVPDGDDGKAIGPYQIHRVYWEDALREEPALGGDYQDCRRRAYAERVIAAYMRRFAAQPWQAGDAEVIARVHNGGPLGHEKAATRPYWERVRARLP